MSFYLKKAGVEMNGKTIIIEKQSRYGTPEEHLCYIVSQGFHLTDAQNYSALIAKPKFHCNHCGRQAASTRNLCVPIEL
jgi:hypothetical protein